MSRAELKTRVTCIFWSGEDGWRGECVEFAAQVTGRDLDEARRKLIAECYRFGEEALNRGQLPGRPVGDLSEEARLHLGVVLKDGVSVSADDACCGTFRHVLEYFDIGILRDVPALDDGLDLGTLHFVFIPSGDLWVAQCLEYNLGGEGDTPRAAADAALDAIMTQSAMDRVLGKAPLAGVPQAPERYHVLYDQGAPINMNTKELEGTFRVAQAA